MIVNVVMVFVTMVKILVIVQLIVAEIHVIIITFVNLVKIPQIVQMIVNVVMVFVIHHMEKIQIIVQVIVL